MRVGGAPGEAIELDIKVPVAGEDERNIQALAGSIELGLFKAVGWWQVLGLGLDQRDGDGLALECDLYAQEVVDATAGAAAGTAVADLNGPGGLFAADEVLGPAALNGWRDR